MKAFNNKIFAAILLLTVVFSACEDDLNVEPNTAITEDDFLSDPNNAAKLLNGVYNKLLDYNMYSFSWIGMTSITSDDADKGSSPSDTGSDKHKMDNLTFDPTDISFSDVYKGRYEGIYRANNALFYFEELNIDENLKSRFIGEVKFLRALFYFDLVRCFGGVPIVVDKIDINNDELINEVVFVRKTKEEVYAQIEADLLDAANRLPLKSAYPTSELGRATKGAAQTLLAKAYLYQQKWQQAFDLTGEVMASGQYSLMPNYADVWREVGENKQESIFEVQATLTNGLRDYTNVQGPRGTPDLGWGFNSPSANLANSFEPTDQRRAASIMFVPSVLWDNFIAPATWANPRYNYKAYQSQTAELWNGDKGNTAKNHRILKYSDLLLIRAEAAINLGNAGEALNIANTLRNRAGLGPRASITYDELLDERRWEMAMEYDRWFDLVRTGRAQQKMAQDGKTFVSGKHEVFPIPIDQIIQSGGRLIQNPNY